MNSEIEDRKEDDHPTAPGDFVVTPWTVKGEVDYDKLVEEFGTSPITPEIIETFRRLTGEIHPFLRRKIFYSHRDLDDILKRYESGEPFFLYTGRGPSGGVHLGHLIPWIFTKYLQDKFGAELYFQMTDDEKYYTSDKLPLEKTAELAEENTLDLIAIGFDPKKTFVFTDTGYMKTLYGIGAKVAKHTTFSTAKAVFGFENSTSIGMIFFPALQAAVSFLPSGTQGLQHSLLDSGCHRSGSLLAGHRQGSSSQLGFFKPAQIHSKFMPSLGQGGKMSASQPETAIFTTDSQEAVMKKVRSSFTGGRDTLEEQRLLGGRADICPVYHYYYFLFEPDDQELKRIYDDCTSGQLLCGDCKNMLASRVKRFIADHAEKREAARAHLDEFIVEDVSGGLTKRSELEKR